MEPSTDKTDYISRLSAEEHVYAKEYGKESSFSLSFSFNEFYSPW
jgi:hypothetical protein